MFKNISLNNVRDMISSFPQETVIGEFAGRDSIAAIIKAFERDDITIVLPIASFAGVEYGESDALIENHDMLSRRIEELYGKSKTLLPLMFYSRPDLWYAINGRFISILNQKYGFYTPCIGCHAYFHILRAPIAYELGRTIISGERISHDGDCKINQLPDVLQIYRDIIGELGSNLIHPIVDIQDGNQIDEIIGFNYVKSDKLPQCVFSGNYKDIEDNMNYNMDNISIYMNKFLVPACIELGRHMINEDRSTKDNFVNIVRDVLEDDALQSSISG